MSHFRFQATSFVYIVLLDGIPLLPAALPVIDAQVFIDAIDFELSGGVTVDSLIACSADVQLFRYDYHVALYLSIPLLSVDFDAVIEAATAVWTARYGEFQH